MTKEELALILDKHKKWLNDDPDGKRADLSSANLRGANLGGANLGCANLGGANLGCANLGGANLGGANLGCANLHGANMGGADLCGADLYSANLHGANMSGADLRRANIDFSCLPLWCGSLSAHFDDRQIIQLIYHTVKSGLNSKNTGEEVKNELTKLIDLANRFHRVDECGRITTF